jgi:molecular chaperone DnaJ
MAISNHYDTLEIHPEATQVEIKQAYRRLVKQFHPDSNLSPDRNHDQIAQINAAYEVLGDPQHRQFYDQQLHNRFPIGGFEQQGRVTYRQRTAAAAQRQYQQQRSTGYNTDEHLQAWLKWVYAPVNQFVLSILEPLPEQIDQLAADPFDDELVEEFQIYLEDCRESLAHAQRCFRSMPNPANLAGVAAHLYYCLNQISDGIEDLRYFTLNYDDHYLHTGQELFRIADGLRWEAEVAIKEIA